MANNLTQLDSMARQSPPNDSTLTYEYFVACPYFGNFGKVTIKDREAFLLFFQKLPQSLKNFLSSPAIAKQLYGLGEEFQLEDSQVTEIASIVQDVTVGNIFIQEFPQALASKLS